MRRLIIFRHAKAERLQPGGSDLSRRLEPRGRSDAEAMGAYLERHKLGPHFAAVSPAVRTRETWALASAAFSPVPPASFEARIYEAEPDDILGVIAATEPKVNTLAIVGHNPGCHELIVMLTGSGDLKIRDRLSHGLPTAGVAVIAFDTDEWHLRPGSGHLEKLVTPQSLSTATD
jgi:phosphohistidine phosphatase